MTATATAGQGYGWCGECEQAMAQTSGHEYECMSCGKILPIVGDLKDASATARHSTVIKMISKNNHCSTFNICSDYSRMQRNAIMEQLNQNNRIFGGPKVPKDVVSKAADIYNEIQQLVISGDQVMDKAPEGAKVKKFVRRGNIKDEMLGAIIYYLCIKVGSPRHRRDIARFMQLTNGGISRGEFIVRNLFLQGMIKELPIARDPTQLYIDRYLEALGVDERPDYANISDFIHKLILRATHYNIGMSSMSPSKVAGAILLVVNGLGLPYDDDKIEAACDGIRRNTYYKFARTILQPANILYFADIFESHGVSHGYEGFIRKKGAQPPSTPALGVPPLEPGPSGASGPGEEAGVVPGNGVAQGAGSQKVVP